MPTIKVNELTLNPNELDALARSILNGWTRELLFQNKHNRDAVFNEAKSIDKQRAKALYRRSTGHQLLDPRYTVEGSDIEDRGLANDYRHSFGNLYVLGNREQRGF